MLRTLIPAAAALCLALMPSMSLAENADQVREFERRVFDLTNAERAKQNLPPFIWHDVLAKAARLHSDDMLRHNMTGHTGSDGSDPRDRMNRQGVTGATSWSENVAYGSPTPEAVVLAWMNSPGHKANILSDKSTHLGVGLVLRPAGSKATYTHYWTQNFIRSSAQAAGQAQVAAPQPAVQPAAQAAPAQEQGLTAAPSQQPAPQAATSEATGRFTAIPNPALRHSSGVNFYWQGKRVSPAALAIYDASDKVVAALDVKDGATSGSGGAKRRVGIWNLKDLDGRPLPTGRYYVRGVLNTSDGESVRIGLTVDLR